MNQPCEPPWSNAQGVVRVQPYEHARKGHTMQSVGRACLVAPCNFRMPASDCNVLVVKTQCASAPTARSSATDALRMRDSFLIAGPIRRRIHNYLNGKQSKMLSKIRGIPRIVQKSRNSGLVISGSFPPVIRSRYHLHRIHFQILEFFNIYVVTTVCRCFVRMFQLRKTLVQARGLSCRNVCVRTILA
jgi:hypothetical protein